MRSIKENASPFVQQPVVAMPPAISVEKTKELYHPSTIAKMCSNENPFGVSPKALAAMEAELPKLCFYADPEPENALKAKVAERLGVQPCNVMITAGAAFALNFIGEVFIQKGDEAIVCSPTYPPYYSIIRKSCGTVVDVPMTKDCKFDFDGLLKAITDKTKVIFLCNPNNPTGCTVTREVFSAFVRQVRPDIIVVSDEAYVQYAKDPAAVTMVPALKEFPNLVVIQTFSKLYGMAAIRVGYAVASQEIISFLQRMSIARALNAAGIQGAIAALDDVEFAEMTVRNNADGRDYLTSEFQKLGFKVYPSESNFVYVDMKEDPKKIVEKLLPYGIVLRANFPLMRISIGTREQNERLVLAIRKTL